MRNYLLLTPGPLSTSESVRQAMLQDWCTWDKDYNEGVVTVIREQLLKLAGLDGEYTTVLLQGSGTYAVEATLSCAVRPQDKLLIVANGAYGKRMGDIARRHGLNHVLVSLKETVPVTPEAVRRALEEHPDISHLAMVHCETTTGILNPVEAVARAIRGRGLTFIVDAMSSFGGIPIDIRKLGIDFLVSSANKCIQGVPGFGFVIARRSSLSRCEGVSRSLSLDLYDQWAGDGKGPWQVALYLSHACGARLLPGREGAGRGGRHRSPPCPVPGKPCGAGGGNAPERVPDLASGRAPVPHHHVLPVPGGGF